MVGKIVYISSDKFGPLKEGRQKSLIQNSLKNFQLNQKIILLEYNRTTLESTGKTSKKIITHIQDMNDGNIILSLDDYEN